MSFLPTLREKLKLATIVFGIISVGIMATIYDEYISWPGSFHRRELLFFYVTISTVTASALLAIASNIKIIYSRKHWNTVDAGLHAFLGALLAMGWSVYVGFMNDLIEKLRAYNQFEAPMFQKWLIKAGFVVSFEILNILLYMWIALLAGKASHPEQNYGLLIDDSVNLNAGQGIDNA